MSTDFPKVKKGQVFQYLAYSDMYYDAHVISVFDEGFEFTYEDSSRTYTARCLREDWTSDKSKKYMWLHKNGKPVCRGSESTRQLFQMFAAFCAGVAATALCMAH